MLLTWQRLVLPFGAPSFRVQRSQTLWIIVTCRKMQSEGPATWFSFSSSRIRTGAVLHCTPQGKTDIQRILLSSQRTEILGHHACFCTDVRRRKQTYFASALWSAWTWSICTGERSPCSAPPCLSSAAFGPELACAWLGWRAGRWIGISLQLSLLSAGWLTVARLKNKTHHGFHHLRVSFCFISCGCLIAISRIMWP